MKVFKLANWIAVFISVVIICEYASANLHCKDLIFNNPDPSISSEKVDSKNNDSGTILAEPNRPLSINANKPTLFTERLTIRIVGISDLDQVKHIWMNPDVIKMSGDKVSLFKIMQNLSISETELFNQKNLKKSFFNFGIYINQRLVGLSQIYPLAKDLYQKLGSTKNHKWVSLSYHLDPLYWGQGIATEAVERLIRFVFEELETDFIHAQVVNSNIGSINVLQKLGFEIVYQDNLEITHFYLQKDNL